MAKKRSAKADGSVLDWIDASDPEDIADALLSVDEAKAALVVKALIERAEGEGRRMLDAVGKEFQLDPVGTLLRGVVGTLSRTSRGG